MPNEKWAIFGALKNLAIKTFDIPAHYRSLFIGKIKEERRGIDRRKEDLSPTCIDFGPVQFLVARHFGFCYGVENAIERSYQAIEENLGKRIYVLSEIIHNPEVNEDLQERGARFIFDTQGNQLIPWDEIKPEDAVIIPAFGCTVEIKNRLAQIGAAIKTYNTTCPFVERVWNKAQKIGRENYAIVIHGKPNHEETRATFSHSAREAPTIVIRNIDEAKILGQYISGQKSYGDFDQDFGGRYSQDFIPSRHLERIGIVNQTTMLAAETEAIMQCLKDAMSQKYGEENIQKHIADTRDTLCYATGENQNATYALMNVAADLGIVVGGYNSSNTSHLVELLEQKFAVYFISSDKEIVSAQAIRHYDIRRRAPCETQPYLPAAPRPLRIVITGGASCPDAIIDRVIFKIASFFPQAKPIEIVLQETLAQMALAKPA